MMPSKLFLSTKHVCVLCTGVDPWAQLTTSRSKSTNCCCKAKMGSNHRPGTRPHLLSFIFCYIFFFFFFLVLMRTV